VGVGGRGVEGLRNLFQPGVRTLAVVLQQPEADQRARVLPHCARPSSRLRESVLGRARAHYGARVGDEAEPGWLGRLRPAARQRSRTQFVRVRWHDLQDLLRERDVLWQAAAEETRVSLASLHVDYGRSAN
jgi:hypothetical protein